MCGIAGMLCWDGKSEPLEPLLARMCEVMQHRGPDAAGTWCSKDGTLGFGFRRLAIVDLSPKANQPMANEDGTIQVVFNGEIYNHAEIRKQLEAIGGHTWRTDHSDTEVIVHAYEQWGSDCVRHFRGMYAIGIWDSRKRELWLIRDPIGIKPLYYTVTPDGLHFASEIKALLQDPKQSRSVDEDMLFHYLSFLVTPAPNTLFAGINKLPSGCRLRASPDGKVNMERWWDPWTNLQPRPEITDAEAADELLSRLKESVRLRKLSDVPVGVFLSGGIDSSLNTVLFSQGESRPVNTFSVGYDRNYSSSGNELEYARKMAAKVGAKHHEIVLTQQDLLDFLPKMIELQDEPIADPVCIPVYYVSKLARDNGVIVCHVGEGADELFCGYPFWDKILRTYRMTANAATVPFQRLAMAGLGIAGQQRSLLREQLRRSAAGQPLFWGGAEAFSQRGKELLLSPRLKAKFRDRTSWDCIEPIYKRFTDLAWEKSPLHWMTYLDLNLRLPELLLMRVDKMSMGTSIEARVPYLDHTFVEFALSLPQSVLYRPGEHKRVLKKAIKGVVPDEVLHRPKQGFAVPIKEWFFENLGGTVRSTLRQFTRETDYFDPKEVENIINLGRTQQMWYLYNFALWWRHYIRN